MGKKSDLMKKVESYAPERVATPVYKQILGIPFIYGAAIGLFTFDIFLEIYHQICFRLYGLKVIPRSEYIKIDRHKLSQLTGLQKFNCVYCGYANGLMAYGTKIIAETERYWCPIKHEGEEYLEKQPHHQEFLERA